MNAWEYIRVLSAHFIDCMTVYVCICRREGHYPILSYPVLSYPTRSLNNYVCVPTILPCVPWHYTWKFKYHSFPPDCVRILDSSNYSVEKKRKIELYKLNPQTKLFRRITCNSPPNTLINHIKMKCGVTLWPMIKHVKLKINVVILVLTLQVSQYWVSVKTD